jgi:small subunit ribosomal protein S8
MINYPVGDFLIRIKNASLVGKNEVVCSKTKLIQAVAEALKQAGFLTEVSQEDNNLVAKLAYRHKKPVLLGLKIVSRPGLRVYLGADKIAKKRGISTLILSTSQGVMPSQEALKKQIGGEVIVEVW